MSVFRSIMSAIFGRAQAAPPAAPADPAVETPASAAAVLAADAASPPPVPPVSATPAPPPAPAAPVDVVAILTGLEAQAGQKLNWRQSIVDLMKLLGLDSSLGARKELAKELGYTGSTDDSAAMNVWLHKQVMRKLADNGGKVPDDLKN